MKAEQIETMPAGRELDRLVGTIVMGLPERTLDDPCPNCGSEMRNCGTRARCFTCVEWIHSPYQEYSTDIEKAWLVVEKLSPADWTMGNGTCFRLDRGYGIIATDGTCPRHEARFFNAIGPVLFDVRDWGDDAPLAICRAALLVALSATGPATGGE